MTMHMNSVRPSAPAIRALEPYDPTYLPADVFMSANESALDVPGAVRAGIVSRLQELEFNRYPDPLANGLRDMIARAWGLERDNVLVGNGGDELLFDAFLAWGGPNRACLSFPPTFSVYAADAALTGTRLVEIARIGAASEVDVEAACARLGQGDIDLVMLTSPNNPTGAASDERSILRVLEASDALVVVDEAYGEFGGASMSNHLAEYENLVILHTFSKAYRLAGVRVGYLLGHPFVLDEFKKVRQPYSVDAVSQIVAEEALKHRDLFEDGVQRTRAHREALASQLASIEGVSVHPSDANYLLFYVEDAADVWRRLYEEHSVLVRNVSGDPLLPDCLRVTVCTPRENDRFIAALKAVLAEREGE